MKRNFKPLPRSTKLIVEFHDGIHSTYTTKGDIIKQNVFSPRAMSLSLVNALAKLEADRKMDFDTFGSMTACMTVSAIGYITGIDGMQHTYSLEMAAHRIESEAVRNVRNLVTGKGI
jgi:hypothetical protein